MHAGYTIGRIVLASLFYLGGLNKVLDAGPTVTAMEAAGLPFASLLVWAVIALELGGGLVVAFGPTVGWTRLTQVTAFALALHTALINVMFHDFWNHVDLRAQLELSLFFKNVAVIGGLMMVGAFPGDRMERDQSSTR